MNPLLVLVFAAGLLLGTLLNIIIIRLPREKRLVGWPRCTRTGEPLALWQVLPVVGWLIQGGRARDGRPLARVYLFVEVFTALVLALFYQFYGFSVLFFYLVFVSLVLIITGAIDWTHRYIYTFVILGATVLVLLLNLVVTLPGLNLLNAGLGLLASGIFFALMFVLAQVLFPGKWAPFGLGDVYLGIFIGAAVGLTRLTTAVTYGVLMAGAVAAGLVAAKYLLRNRNVPTYMPYGSYLCLGVIIYLLVRGW